MPRNKRRQEKTRAARQQSGDVMSVLQKQQTEERRMQVTVRWAHLEVRMCLQLETRLRATRSRTTMW